MKVRGPKSLRRAHQPISVTCSPTFSLRSAPHECVRSRLLRFSIIESEPPAVAGSWSCVPQTLFESRDQPPATAGGSDCSLEQHRPSINIYRLAIDPPAFF